MAGTALMVSTMASFTAAQGPTGSPVVKVNVTVPAALSAVPGVSDADVWIVWQPAWKPAMMSEEAKKKVQFFG